MPRKFLFTREQIVDAALEITRERGISAVTARALGERLGASSKPIFSQFKSMDEVLGAVREAAEARYQSTLAAAMERAEELPYKASGMAYIRFAKEERELFKLLFMRDRTGEAIEDGRASLQPLLTLIEQKTGMSEEEAYRFHLEMWIYVHGIATMAATAYLNWPSDSISDMLSDAFWGLQERFRKKREANG